MNCECHLICGHTDRTRHNHICTLISGHDGRHSCHGRIFRTEPRKGDITWDDNEPRPITREDLKEAITQTLARWGRGDISLNNIIGAVDQYTFRRQPSHPTDVMTRTELQHHIAQILRLDTRFKVDYIMVAIDSYALDKETPTP